LKQTVWVTGAAGFTGRFMIEALQAQGDDVRVVGLDVAAPPAHAADAFFAIDLCEPGSLRRAIGQAPPDVVIHLAGLMPPRSEAEMRRVNVEGSVALGAALIEAGVEGVRVVSAGSAAEYRGGGAGAISEQSPIGSDSPYGRTKSEQSERLLQLAAESGLSVLIARPFNLLGPGLSAHLVAGALCQQFMTNGQRGYIRPKGPTESVRDFIDVRDVVSAYWDLAQKGESGEVYNVCTGIGTPVARIVEILEEAFGMTVEVRPDYDPELVRPSASIGDNGKLVALGWQPRISLEESVRSLVRAARGEGP